MANNYLLHQNSKIFKAGSSIFQTGDNPRPAVVDFNPEVMDLANGAFVASWKNAINGNDARQTTAASQPIFRSGQINGLPVIDFDGVNDKLDLVLAATIKTLFIVVRTQTPNQNFGTLLQGTINGNGTRAFFGGNGGRYFQSVNGGGGLDANQYNKIYVNGIPATIDSALRQTYFTLMSMDFDDLRALTAIGMTETYPFQGQMARIIGYDYRMTTIDRTKKEKELITKYAL